MQNNAIFFFFLRFTSRPRRSSLSLLSGPARCVEGG